MIQLVVFLGNYGREYEKTRHNVAWQFASSLPFYQSLNWQSKFKGQYAVVETEQLAQYCCNYDILQTKEKTPVKISDSHPKKIYFLKPETYMNNSGQSIIELANFYKIKPEETLIIHDELELPIGTVSLKWSGGLGGHNGLRSTKAVFSTADFFRIRFGISRPTNKDIADYVLSNFTQDESIILSQIFVPSAQLLAKTIFSKEPEKLIQEWGKKKLIQ